MKRDYTIIPDYSKRQMFLDPAGAVTTQRFDDYAYPKIAKFDETQRGAFWVPEEINLTKDKLDYRDASKAMRHMFTANLLRQTTLDSEQGRAPIQIFGPVCSIPELESLMTTWTWFEQIHSRAYSHIIRNIYNIPKDEFNKIHDNEEIINMIASVGKYYDNLHRLNCQKELGIAVNEEEHIDAIYLALITCYALEGIRFTVSFGTSLAMVENKLFIGNGNEIALILSDEMLHCDWTAYILNTLIKNDPRFAAAAKRCQAEAMRIFQDVIREEKQWAKYLFKEGSVIGLNETTLCQFVDWTAQYRLKDVGFKYDAGIKTTPLPWFNKHLNSNKKQTALQENESVAYVISSMSNQVDYDALPNI
jgi:ribonucleoside-diphosphate reductase beta chain